MAPEVFRTGHLEHVMSITDERVKTVDRVKNKPKTNDGSLPVMEYDFKDQVLQEITKNIWHAQKAGWDRILTYDLIADRVKRKRAKRAKRYWAIEASGVVVSRESSADEYPFASTIENSGSVFIGHATKEAQDKQGRLISAFYKLHRDKINSDKPFYFEVRTINVPDNGWK